ncbi:MAG: hypothetical protein ABI665_07485 [Vicinamibacterales bacterium]
MTIAVLLLIVLIAGPVAPAAAQAPPASRFGITDNSFLIEEAFNQEAGIFQNIFVMARNTDNEWDGSFTQEWPVVSQRHQFSFTLPFSAVSNAMALGDLGLNYRVQVTDGEGRFPAFSPRLTLLSPTSAERRSLGGGGIGWQVNLPFSKQAGRMFFHGNAGTTLLPVEASATSTREWSNAPFTGGSAIVAVTPMFNLMLESLVVWTHEEGVREPSVTVSPGFRLGWNLGDQQIVIGIGVPVTRGDRHDTAVLGYFSYELPFRHK